MAALDEIVSVAESAVDYDLTNDRDKCITLIGALRKLRIRRPRSVTVEGNPVSFEDLMRMLTDAEHWLANHPAPGTNGGSTTYYDTTNIRGY